MLRYGDAVESIPTREGQEEVFVWQLRLAAERSLPASIHCLEAWGRLLEILRTEARPACGFVLHSFGGPREMISERKQFTEKATGIKQV